MAADVSAPNGRKDDLHGTTAVRPVIEMREVSKRYGRVVALTVNGRYFPNIPKRDCWPLRRHWCCENDDRQDYFRGNPPYERGGSY